MQAGKVNVLLIRTAAETALSNPSGTSDGEKNVEKKKKKDDDGIDDTKQSGLLGYEVSSNYNPGRCTYTAAAR